MHDPSYHLADYDYNLPTEHIAQFPAPQRDSSRLLVLDLGVQHLSHRSFTDLCDLLRAGDLLVVNTTKVFPARLLGHKETGGKAEIFLLSFPRLLAKVSSGAWQEAAALALIKSSKRPKIGSLIRCTGQLQVRIDRLFADGKAEIVVQFQPKAGQDLAQILEEHGQMPLPPYISRPDGALDADQGRYQTRYACQIGSVAAPTAGLHFSDELLAKIRAKGVAISTLVLHVGYGTFAPVRAEDIRDHVIHKEAFTISPETAAAIQQTQQRGGRIWAVGTTTVRTLEFAADAKGQIQPGSGECDLFIYPGYQFRVVDNLITNFHLPKSSLLFLVSALAGRQRILDSYHQAIQNGYRFFSYGDAMAIITKP